MTTATDEEMCIEVRLPSGLLEEIDQYARVNGHPTRSAVVAEALQE